MEIIHILSGKCLNQKKKKGCKDMEEMSFMTFYNINYDEGMKAVIEMLPFCRGHYNKTHHF